MCLSFLCTADVFAIQLSERFCAHGTLRVPAASAQSAVFPTASRTLRPSAFVFFLCHATRVFPSAGHARLTLAEPLRFFPPFTDSLSLMYDLVLAWLLRACVRACVYKVCRYDSNSRCYLYCLHMPRSRRHFRVSVHLSQQTSFFLSAFQRYYPRAFCRSSHLCSLQASFFVLGFLWSSFAACGVCFLCGSLFGCLD